MAISYPTWWMGLRWEMARLMEDLFTGPNLAADGLTGVKVERFLTVTEASSEWLDTGNGYIMVHRNGGHLDIPEVGGQPWVDNAIVTLGALTMSPDKSHELMDYVTTVLIEFSDGGIVHRSTPHRSGLVTTFMKVPGEVVAPQMIPDQFRDERLVPMVWSINADVPRGLPNYRAYLGLDN